MAFDPGNTKLATGVTFLRDRQEFVGKGYCLSRGQYYHDIKAAHFEAQAKRWTAPLREHYAGLTAHPRRSGDLASFLQYLDVWRESFPVVMAEMLKKRWRKSYFERHQLKMKVLTKFFADVQRGRVEDGTYKMAATIVFGSAKFRSSRKGVRASPTVAVLQAALLVFGRNNVFLEHEFLTSQMDAVCGQRLWDVYTQEPPTRRERRAAEARQARYDAWQADAAAARAADASAPNDLADGHVFRGRRFAPRPPRAPRCDRLVWGLKYCACRICPASGHRLKDRDVNAAKNIMAAFLARVNGQPRPAYLCPVPRESGEAPVPRGPKPRYDLPQHIALAGGWGDDAGVGLMAAVVV